MGRKGIIGRKGEDKACEYLKMERYEIIERNFRCKSGEIDIIAIKNGKLHFIEVKTRSSTDYGHPAESVTVRKQRRLLASAKYYLLCNKQYGALKYFMDVIEILLVEDRYYIHFIMNAFEEGER